MTVSNNDLANQGTFNSSFVSREVDTDTVGTFDLKKTDGVSGSHLMNVQKAVNSIASALGMSTSQVYNFLITWSANYVGAPSDTVKMRVDALVAKFAAATSHNHNGTDGQGEVILASNISSVVLRGYVQRGTDLTGVTGGSHVVTSEMTGKVDSSGSSSLGVVVTAPYNKVALLNSSGDSFDDGAGNQVYSRLTYSAGVWTLTFYVDLSGTETAYSFSGSNAVKWFYQELFNPISGAPVYNEAFFTPSDNATQDIPDATASQRGLMSASAQTIGGQKTFNAIPILNTLTSGGVLFLNSSKEIAQAVTKLFWDATNFFLGIGTNAPAASLDLNGDIAIRWTSTATAATINALATPTSAIRFTGSTVTTLNGVAGGVNGKEVALLNKSSAIVTLKHEAGGASAADRIVTSDAGDLELAPDSIVTLRYDDVSSRWLVGGGAGGGGGGLYFVTGSEGTPSAIIAGTGVAFTGTKPRSLWFITTSGLVDVTANPQIAAGSIVAQELLLLYVGTESDGLILDDGTGLALNGQITMTNGSSITLIWTGSVWREVARRT
jgi:hypothetical protein